jgi:acyl-CoA synthetase (AMP-forming)/AMP-acid ligase II/acyl carrier protein
MVKKDVRDSNWVQVLLARAQSQRDRLAYRFLPDGENDEQSITYGGLLTRAQAIASTLQQKVAPGDRVLLLCPPGIEFISGFLGCLFARAIAVPAAPARNGRQDRNAQRIAGMMSDCCPKAALTISSLTKSIDANLAIIAIDTISDGHAASWKDPTVDANTVACLQYTSGSTGTPRGVVLSHQNLLSNCEAIAQAFKLTPDDVGAGWLPPYHDMGLIGGILSALYVGFPVTLMSPQSFLTKPVRWVRAMSRFGATLSGAPDFAFDFCARTLRPEECAGLDLSKWRLAFTGAEPIRMQSIDAFSRAFAPFGFKSNAFFPCYGLAEATLMVSGVEASTGAKAKSIASLRDKNVVSCGRACGGVEIAIINPHTQQPCNEGQIGEIWLRGGSVARGYWRGSEGAFDAQLNGDGAKYLRTGDLGLIDQGELFVTGRLKELIIIRGVNHYPHDIEQTAQSAHVALRPGFAAAFGYERDGVEKLAIAIEIERTQRNADPKPIIDAIRAKVAQGHEVEASAILLLMPGELPKTPSGKTQRGLCREQFLAATLACVAKWEAQSAPPAPIIAAAPVNGELKGWLVEQLASRVGVTPNEIDADEPLARYGLDSASAVSMALEIEKALGRDLPATLFWDYPSITLLAEYLESTAVEN